MKATNERTGSRFKLRFLFRRSNRGILLDITVFLLNLFLMRILLREFVGIIRRASSGESFASAIMFVFCLCLFVLPPAGATLKRWHFHKRLRDDIKAIDGEAITGGCLFNPILYFCLTAIIFSIFSASPS